MTGNTGSFGKEGRACLLLIALGVGTRLTFAILYPTIPFWDFLQIVHFGVLIRDHGLFAPGWYWRQFNPGLPMLLSLFFRLPFGTIATARIATAVATGLVPLIPFLVWRRVVGFRIRLLAGALLALWPGQIFFSGAPALDNWVLLPTIAIGSLAVRRLLDPTDPGHPVSAALLYGAAFAIRQEMAVALLPLVLAAAAAPRPRSRRRRQYAVVAAIVVVTLLAVGFQRRAATGRFQIGSEHSALSLYGSFVPSASVAGWIDARAQAVAEDPSFRDGSPYGSQRALLRLTWNEAMRRPGFHLARVATWIPRLALNADGENLYWSVGSERALPPERQEAGRRFQNRWARWLRLELALVHGLFVATAFVGWRRRNAAILVLVAAVFLKFMIHAVVAPVGRVVVPAIALELLAIPLGIAVLVGQPMKERMRFAALAGASAVLLLVLTPVMAAEVMRRDSPVLPGVRRFALAAGGGCDVRCEVERGSIVGLAPFWVQLRATPDGSADAVARLGCALPVLAPDESLVLKLYDFDHLLRSQAGVALSLRVDGQEMRLPEHPAGSLAGPAEVVVAGAASGQRSLAPDLVLEARRTGPAVEAPEPPALTIGFERRTRAADSPVP